MTCSSGAVERSGAPSAFASSPPCSFLRGWAPPPPPPPFKKGGGGGGERIAQYFGRKKPARRGMSSRLSERGGTRIGKTFNRSKRSSRNFPSVTIRRRSRLIAATTRPRNFRVSFDPSLENSFSCSTRRSFPPRKPPVSLRGPPPPR